MKFFTALFILCSALITFCISAEARSSVTLTASCDGRIQRINFVNLINGATRDLNVNYSSGSECWIATNIANEKSQSLTLSRGVQFAACSGTLLNRVIAAGNGSLTLIEKNYASGSDCNNAADLFNQ